MFKRFSGSLSTTEEHIHGSLSIYDLFNVAIGKSNVDWKDKQRVVMWKQTVCRRTSRPLCQEVEEDCEKP
jgi:hypothetical protein